MSLDLLSLAVDHPVGHQGHANVPARTDRYNVTQGTIEWEAMMTAPQTFDPVTYKTTTRAQWETAASAWHRWGPVLETWLGEATELMLDQAHVRTGSRVLDVAAGAGGQSIAAARRVGPDGAVLATDISPNVLAFAQSEAARAGLSNLVVAEMDAEDLDIDHGSYDAVISRLGLIYLPNLRGALLSMRGALRPGGRLAAVVYSTAQANEFIASPVSIVRRRAALPPPLPGHPGPFGLGGPGVLAAALGDAGFADVQVHTVVAPLGLASSSECVRFERESFGALHQMLARLDSAGQAAAWDEISNQLAAFDTGAGFAGPCELLVGSGTKP
jgi:SAM-dependent methyltransferase